MKADITELIATLGVKGSLMRDLKGLLHQEQECMIALDLPRLEENQQEITAVMERMMQLGERCKGQIAALGADLGLPWGATLTPIIARMPQPQQKALREAQERVLADSRELTGALTLNRGLLEDSLKVVERSVNFFNRLFNPGQTYGYGGALVASRGGSRFVCKEI